MMTRRMKVCAVAMLVLGTTACDLDLQDPNIPTEEEVISSPTTLAQVVVGVAAEPGMPGTAGPPLLPGPVDGVVSVAAHGAAASTAAALMPYHKRVTQNARRLARAATV